MGTKRKKTTHLFCVEETGSGYKKQYIIEILVDNIPLSRGQDFSIKGAEQNAAEKAWNKLTKENPDIDKQTANVLSENDLIFPRYPLTFPLYFIIFVIIF